MPSRAERRAYERMTKNQDPRALPLSPAQRARAERVAQRRAAAKTARAGRPNRSYWVRAVIVALIAGVLAFSVAWPTGMPLSLAIGVGVTLVVMAVAAVMRSALGRAADAARNAARPKQ